VELPDNLKTLFRPVAMMVPDTSLICEVLFYCQCFSSASVLAHKLAYFYHSIASQTSTQVWKGLSLVERWRVVMVEKLKIVDCPGTRQVKYKSICIYAVFII